MTIRSRARLACLVLAAAAAPAGSAWAQSPSAPPAPPPPYARAPDMSRLAGTWVRPDGGYRIVVKAVDANGRLEAMYFNPQPLPFSVARAWTDGGIVRAAFELRAGGYNGSTYDLVWDAARDALTGTYHQAVANQTYQVTFVRR